MKKTIIIILLAAFACNLYAAVGDVEITIVIPAAKVDDFSAGFLQRMPIPTLEDPNDPGVLLPQFTKKQWIKYVIRRILLKIYAKGKMDLARQASIIDPNAVQE
jgi:hypothetical protein